MHVIKNRVSEEIGTMKQRCEENSITKSNMCCAAECWLSHVRPVGQHRSAPAWQVTTCSHWNRKVLVKADIDIKIVKKADIDKSPPLPKIRHSRKVKLSLETANNALQNIKKKLEQQLSLTKVNELFYATTSVVAEVLDLQSRARIHKRLEAPKWKKNNWTRNSRYKRRDFRTTRSE